MTDNNAEPDNLAAYARAQTVLDGYVAQLTHALNRRVAESGKPVAQAVESAQLAAHGLAWIATTAEGLRQLLAWAVARKASGTLAEADALKLHIGFVEGLAQALGRMPIGPGEFVGAVEMDAVVAAEAARADADVRRLILCSDLTAARLRLAALVANDEGSAASSGVDATLAEIQEQIRRFASREVAPHAHRWHRHNELIPRPVLDMMSGLGAVSYSHLTLPTNREV